jgi:phosphopantetheine adenylyltransferase
LVAAAFAIAGAEARDAITARVSSRIASRLINVVGDSTAAVAAKATKSAFHHPMPENVVENVRKTARNLDVKPTPGFLVAALMRGEREHFVRGIARILELPVAGVSRKLASAETESIALAARAANFDSSIVRTIYETLEVRSIPWTIGDDRTVALVWMRCSPGAARTAFAKGMTN